MARSIGWFARMIACGTLALSAAAMAPAASAPSIDDAVPKDASLSVLTYNVEGLPMPVAFGRSAAADRIAARLKALRDEGRQPHVVVLQEAFGASQRAIGRKAGYRYLAFGPDARDPAADMPMTDADRAFAAGASALKGERLGKWAGSGLAILSDYPIVSVRKMAFPAFACAGFDCMANKGVLLAMVQVPGSDRPVAVIATHMNSKDASGVTKARWNYAFDRQVAAIGSFLQANLDADTPYVFAGDTNIGRSLPRRAAFEAMLAGLPRAGGDGVVRTALTTCLDQAGGCAIGSPADVEKAYRHGKDWQVYAASAETTLRPIAIQAPFGHDASGRMLSDHIGYTAFYRLAATGASAGRAMQLALR